LSSEGVGAGRSLAELADCARAAGRFGIDTEFMGEGRYRTLLCLIQLAIPLGQDGAKHVELIDPLAEGFDGAPLAALLADADVQVIVHAGRQDIALARRVLATEVVNVFDTQVAAGFAGMGAQSSYESLLADALGIRVAKTASFTRWDRRPLSAEQLSYAREDVVHLLELAAELKRRLGKLGRLEWALEECRPLQEATDERDLERIFSRLPRVRGLSPSSRPVARALVQWREETAERQDRPVQGVLSDAGLMEIAKRKPTSTAELEQIRGSGASNFLMLFPLVTPEIVMGVALLRAVGIVARPLGAEPDVGSQRPQALLTYMASLEQTREMELSLVLPGHGDPIIDHAALIDERFRMHRRRAEKIRRLIATEPRTAHEIAQELWGNVAVTQAFLTLSEVLGHADLLLKDGSVVETEADGIVRFAETP